MKKIVTPILVALTWGAAASAMAQTAAPAAPAEPESTLAYNAGVVSDYRYRGISQSRKQAALQGGVDYNDKSGFYVGAWGSTIKWIQDAGAKDGNVEIDLYGGYKGAAGDVAYDVGFLRYQYQGNTYGKANGAFPGYVDANTNEVYGAATLGLFTAKYSYAISNLFGNKDSKGSYYLDLSAALDLGESYSLTPHLGYQSVAKNPEYTYTDYSLTLGKDLGNGLSGSAAVIGTNAKNGAYAFNGNQLGKSSLVVGVKYTF
jgi:uncharacterized protein (TIGR02001 family)